MLPPEVLDLLQQWWKARPTWHDIGVQRWSFPGRNRHQPLTTRQFGRLLATWREKAQDVRRGGLPCGHYLPEEASSRIA
jgi:hypothetical protein